MAKRRMGRRKAVGAILGGVGGTAAVLGLRRMLRDPLEAEHRRLAKAAFGREEHRQEWARISLAIEKRMLAGERKRKDDYLRALEGILKKTEVSINERRFQARRENNSPYLKALERGIRPADVVYILRRNPPSRSQASFTRLLAEGKRERLGRMSGAEYEKNADSLNAEIADLENAATVCEEADKLGIRRAGELHSLARRIPEEMLEEILLGSGAGRP